MTWVRRFNEALLLPGLLNGEAWWRGGLVSSALLTLGIVVGALEIRLLLSPLLTGAQFITLFPAVIIATLCFGTATGLVAVAAAAVAATRLLGPGVMTAQAGFGLFMFCLIATLDVAIISALLAANAALRKSLVRIERLDADMRASEGRFRDFLESAPDAVVIVDRDDRIVVVNEETERLFGHPREDLLGQPLEVLMPDRYQHDHRGRVKSFVGGPRTRRMGDGHELFGLRKDGTEFPIETNISQLREDGHTLVASVIRDISQRREASERQALLIRELNHRVKNTLASVQAIVFQTLRTASSVEAFGEALTARLSALSQSHDVLTRNDWSGATVRDVAAEQLSPYERSVNPRFHLSGPDVRLRPNRAVTLGMVLGELTTNAAKFGALSVDTGSVDVDWTRADAAGEHRLRLTWSERGGPRVAPPEIAGFGTRLIERSTVAGLRGSASIDFKPGGVSCVIDFPLLQGEA